MQMALIIIPGKILLTAHLYLSIVSTYQSAMLTFPRIKEQSRTLIHLDHLLRRLLFSFIVDLNPPGIIREDWRDILPSWCLLTACKTDLKTRKNPNICWYLFIYSLGLAGRTGCQTNPCIILKISYLTANLLVTCLRSREADQDTSLASHWSLALWTPSHWPIKGLRFLKIGIHIIFLSSSTNTAFKVIGGCCENINILLSTNSQDTRV